MNALIQTLIDKYETWREPCEFCRARKKFRRIMAIIETIPEIGAAVYDDPVSELFNAADNAETVWECYCDWVKP